MRAGAARGGSSWPVTRKMRLASLPLVFLLLRRFRSGSALPPNFFRSGSALLPHFFRSGSALPPHFLRTSSAAFPRFFRTSSAHTAAGMWRRTPVWAEPMCASHSRPTETRARSRGSARAGGRLSFGRLASYFCFGICTSTTPVFSDTTMMLLRHG